MTPIRFLAWTVTLVMAIAVGFGVVGGGLGADFEVVWGRPWGRVALIDLYAGLALFAAWIWFRERKRGVVWAWWLGLIVLGNLAAGVYLVWATHRSSDVTELIAGVSQG